MMTPLSVYSRGWLGQSGDSPLSVATRGWLGRMAETPELPEQAQGGKAHARHNERKRRAMRDDEDMLLILRSVMEGIL